MGQGKKSSGQAGRRGASRNSATRAVRANAPSGPTVAQVVELLQWVFPKKPILVHYVTGYGGKIVYGVPPWTRSKL